MQGSWRDTTIGKRTAPFWNGLKRPTRRPQKTVDVWRINPRHLNAERRFSNGYDQDVRTNQPSSPSLLWHRGHDPCCRPARLERLRRGATQQGKTGRQAYRQAGDEHVVRSTEAD